MENEFISDNEILDGGVDNEDEIKEEILETESSKSDSSSESETAVSEVEKNDDSLVDGAESSEALEIESVSGDDYDSIFNNGFPSVSDNNADKLYVLSAPEEIPFWEKPFKDYSAGEGFMLLLFLFVCFFALWMLLNRK